MAGEFSLNAEQINKLNEITNEGSGNYAAAYDYLRQQIQAFLDAPENASHPDRQAYENTNYWLKLAAEINRNDPNSQANAFIRGVTKNGRAFDGKTADAATVQVNSNIIGKAVIGDVKQFNRVPDIGALLQHDVQSALGQGGQTLAGWGGAFYYWNMPMSKEPGDTVGFRITSDPVEYEKFIALTTKAVLDAASRLRVSPHEFLEQAKTGMNAQAPEAIKAEIFNRVTDYLEGNTQNLMGDPNEIGGYRASIGPDGAVSWYQFDKDMNRIPLQDEAEVTRLNARRNARLEKGLDHPWQAPTTEAHVETIKLSDGTVYQHTYGANGRIQQTVKTNPDGSRSEKSYDPATGSVTQEKQFDKDGVLTFDSVEEARKKAEADKAASEKAAAEKAEADRKAAEQAAAQKAEADRVAAEQAAAAEASQKAEAERIAAEQQAAAQVEAERVAAEDARLKADPVGSLTDDQIRAYDRNQAFLLLNLVYNMPDKESHEHQMHLMLQRFGALNPRIQGDIAALIINGGKGFDPIRFPTDAPGLHPSSPSFNPLALTLPPIDWDKGIILPPIIIEHKPSIMLAFNHDDVGDGSSGRDGKLDQPNEIAFTLWKTEDERQTELNEKGIYDTGQPVIDQEGFRQAFDSNLNNVLDMRDARWNEFRIWQNNSQNGTSDAGELLTLQQTGIRLIDLMPSEDGVKAFADGSLITGTNPALMNDGTKMLTSDITPAYRQLLSAY